MKCPIALGAVVTLRGTLLKGITADSALRSVTVSQLGEI